MRRKQLKLKKMRLIFSIFFILFFINISDAQLAGIWKGKMHDKEVTMDLTSTDNVNFTGNFVSERYNYMLQVKQTDNGFEGRGKDRVARASAAFVAVIEEDKNKMTVTITTTWIDKVVEEKAFLTKQK